MYPAKENEFRKIKKKQDIIKEKTEEINKYILPTKRE